MSRAFPSITESSDELKAQMKQETEPLKRQRLHLLYLVASGQADSRTDAATTLGVHRNTVGRWLDRYEQAGLASLLQVTPPPGAVPALNADQVATLRDRLAEPNGFASYGEVQAWLKQTFGVDMKYQATHKLVRYKLGAKLKVARPTHPKKTVKP